MSRFTVPAHKKFSDDLSVILIHTERQKMRSTALKKVAGEVLIDQQITVLKKVFGPSIDIVLVLGFDATNVIKYLQRKVRIITNERFDETDIATSIFIGLLSTVANNVFIVDGTIPINETLFTTSDKSYVTISKDGKDTGAVISNNKVIGFAYGVEHKLGNILFLNKDGVKAFLENYNSTLVLPEIMHNMLEQVEFVCVKS